VVFGIYEHVFIALRAIVGTYLDDTVLGFTASYTLMLFLFQARVLAKLKFNDSDILFYLLAPPMGLVVL